MARAPKAKKVGRRTPRFRVELCWILVGERRGRVWLCRRLRPVRGEAARVCFDAAWVLNREERQGDVLGFFHTHPGMRSTPSARDVRTMRAWASAFGKPLLCLIEGKDGLRGWLFRDHAADGRELDIIQSFTRGVLIGVGGDGE